MEGRNIIERRAHRRVDLPATAVLVRAGTDRGRYIVQNLSAAGALLTGDGDVPIGSPVNLRLEINGHAPVSVRGRVLRRGETVANMVALAISFRHSSPDTEDAIQQAVLDALESAVRSEPFFKDVQHYF
jgi:hypothetical protein